MIICIRNWLKKQSLFFKLSLGILISAFIGITLLIGVVTQRSKRIIEEQILELTDNAIRASVENVNHLVLETEQAVRGLRNTLNHLHRADVESIRIGLQSTIKAIHNSGLNLSHAAIYVFPTAKGRAGTMYSAFADDHQIYFKQEIYPNIYKKFPWLQEAASEEKIYWSEPYDSPNSPTPSMVISCVLPFKFQGQDHINGLVSISVDIQDIQEYMNESPFSHNGQLLLISKKGLYITHPDPEINLKLTIYELAQKLKLPKIAQVGEKVLSGQSGHIRTPYSSLYGKPTVFFFAPVPTLKWGVSLVYAQDQLFKPITDLQAMIILTAALGLPLFIFFIGKVCHDSTRPLRKLAQIATQYGKGDFSADPAGSVTEDEIGTLSKAFYNMRFHLMEYINKEKKEASERQKILSEMEIAKQIQLSALPFVFPQHEKFELHALMYPARKIGGDFYDFFFLNKHKIALVIADVSGKGISAALYMMQAQEIIKHTAQYTRSIEKVFERVNDVLCEGNKACMFVSAFFAVIDLESGEMEYVNAGHMPPFIIAGENCQKLEPLKNFVLGIREGISYHAQKIILPPQSFLYLYTDGITEAENTQGEFYGEKRLYEILCRGKKSARKLNSDILNDIAKFSRNTSQSDDITMLCFFYRGPSENSMETDAEITALPLILDFIKNDMALKKLPENICSKMIMIAEEIFTNIASYAYEKSGKVRIKTSLSPDQYTVVFMDRGKPYNPLEHTDPSFDLPLKSRTPGGLGIFLAKRLSDKLEYEHQKGENILKAVINIKLPN